ncbi:MAG: tetratricopeptide repeat protein, partial [Aphanizomenon gracile PMC638.10]|nr:tetratricopeptide repeat protein [Aphanizomenon gracile PMC638.10]
EQSRELYQQLGKETSVANMWDWLAEDRIALAYYQLGTIYQEWGKYEQAISYHEQSRELYQELGKEKDVADSWSNLAYCYKE